MTTADFAEALRSFTPHQVERLRNIARLNRDPRDGSKTTATMMAYDQRSDVRAAAVHTLNNPQITPRWISKALVAR